MKHFVFKGAGARVEGEVNLHGHTRLEPNPAHYQADPALTRAVNVALTLGMPLLLTGEPGTGKTQLAHRLAWEMGLGRVDRFNTKSSSVAADLFYQFDNVRYFGEAQMAAALGQPVPSKAKFIRYHALGLAILRSLGWAGCQGRVAEAQAAQEGLHHAAPTRSLVLIDEVDKAPRDFPNDLLHQLENYSFDVPELDDYDIRAHRERLPVIIITSNSEKQLPDAFLRRCVYHHIEVPREAAQRQAWLEQVLHANLTAQCLQGARGPGWERALAYFFELRDRNVLQKPPSTAEALDWVQALAAQGVQWAQPLETQADKVSAALGTLIKTSELTAERERWLSAART